MLQGLVRLDALLRVDREHLVDEVLRLRCHRVPLGRGILQDNELHETVEQGDRGLDGLVQRNVLSLVASVAAYGGCQRACSGEYPESLVKSSPGNVCHNYLRSIKTNVGDRGVRGSC